MWPMGYGQIQTFSQAGGRTSSRMRWRISVSSIRSPFAKYSKPRPRRRRSIPGPEQSTLLSLATPASFPPSRWSSHTWLRPYACNRPARRRASLPSLPLLASGRPSGRPGASERRTPPLQDTEPLRRADRLLPRGVGRRRDPAPRGTLCGGDGRLRGAHACLSARFRARRPALRRAGGRASSLPAPRTFDRPGPPPLDGVSLRRAHTERATANRGPRGRGRGDRARGRRPRGLPTGCCVRQRRLGLSARRLPRPPLVARRARTRREEGRRAALGRESRRARGAGVRRHRCLLGSAGALAGSPPRGGSRLDSREFWDAQAASLSPVTLFHQVASRSFSWLWICWT